MAQSASSRIEFDCKEEDCPLKVHYERITQGGFAKLRTAVASQPTFAAFLTCDNGHVHRYDIPNSQ
jgi:hypothetical protein